MANFKIGDKVQYIRGEMLQFGHQFGVIYTIRSVDGKYVSFVEAPTIVLAKRLTKAYPTPRRFISGQTVVCIEADLTGPASRLTVGKSYVIHGISTASGRLRITDDTDVRRFFDPSRFQSKVEYEQDKLNRFFEVAVPGEIIPVPRGMVAGQMLFQAMPQQVRKKPKAPRSIKIDPVDAKAALTKMLKDVYGIDATVEQVIGSMDKSLELVLGA